jgi:cytochrome b561
MQFFSSAENYGLIAKLSHWLIAVLIIALLGIGWWMVDLNYYDPWYHEALTWHKSLGLIVGFVVIFKLFSDLVNASPEPQASLSSFERIASRFVHYFLRLTMLVIPATGYLISTSEGAVIDVFDWFSVPVLLEVNNRIRDIAIEFHYYFAYATLALVVLHIAAALKHQFIDHKGTLKRML